MFKFISEDSHKLIKVNWRSTLTDNQLEDCFDSDIFTDEITNVSPKYFDEYDDKINTTLFKFSFKIISSEIDGNCLFNNLNSFFWWTINSEYFREEICDIII